jgi:hypothetical protein
VDHELSDLRAEVERLLAAALASDQQHADALRERDRSHAADTERRELEHDAELRLQDDEHEIDVANLNRAIQSRDLIGQAKGIIMATMRCTADEAFELLKQQSQAENRKLTEIADELTRRVVRRAGSGI